jgi:hypothetical protein
MLEHHMKCTSVRESVPEVTKDASVCYVTGTEMGIFPPFAYDNSNGSARYDDPNPRQRAGPATLHFLPGL